jgi:AcrR family transcriptional regulator
VTARASQPTNPADEPGGARHALIRAAVDSIVEDGYYRTSSNEIARRAGVSWGAIQYHFGSRDELFIGVLQQSALDFIQSLADFDPGSNSLQDRLRNLAGLIWQHHSSPEYAAILQIDLNLSRDPKLAEPTARTLEQVRDDFRSGWEGLRNRTFSSDVIDDGLDRFVFHVLQGMALVELLNREMGRGFAKPNDDTEFVRERELLVSLLTEFLRRRGPSGKPANPPR